MMNCSALNLMWLKNNSMAMSISVIYLLGKIKLDKLCLSLVIPEEKTHLSVGLQDHENCFGRGQGVDGGRREAQLVLVA